MPVSLTLPTGYWIERSRDGFALHNDTFGEIGNADFSCWASACYAAQDHAADLAAEVAADEYAAELERIADLINAQGGYVAPDDFAGQARGRAINAALAAISSIKPASRVSA